MLIRLRRKSMAHPQHGHYAGATVQDGPAGRATRCRVRPAAAELDIARRPLIRVRGDLTHHRSHVIQQPRVRILRPGQVDVQMHHLTSGHGTIDRLPRAFGSFPHRSMACGMSPQSPAKFLRNFVEPGRQW